MNYLLNISNKKQNVSPGDLGAIFLNVFVGIPEAV